MSNLYFESPRSSYLMNLLVDGLEDADLEQLLVAREQSDAARAVATYCLACAPHLESVEQKVARDELDEILAAVLSGPEISRTTSTTVLLVALRWSLVKRRREDCIRYARILSKIDDERVPVRLRLAVALEELGVWRSIDDSSGYDSAHQRAVALRPAPGTGPWLSLWTEYLLEMVNRRQVKAALGAIEKLAPLAESLAEHRLQSFGSLKAYFCFSFGRIEEGLKLFERADLAEASRRWSLEAQMYTMLMIFAGRCSEAEARLDELSVSLSDAEQGDFDVIQGYACLARRDIDGVRELAQRAIARSEDLGAIQSNAVLLLANAELVERRAGVARRLLQSLDPNEHRPYFDMQWARLYVLEEDFQRAAVFFGRILEQRLPEYVEDRVRFAYELSALDLARLSGLAASRGTNALPAGMETRVERRGSHSLAKHEGAREQGGSSSPSGGVVWIGESAASRKVRDLIRDYAPLDATVLVSGETGTGKEVAARLLHAEGNRRGAPFLPIHCGALSESLMESELFGHVKGSFTGATGNREGLLMAAGSGVVFLDEIHAMPARLQSALLRVLENGEVRPVGSTRLLTMQARIVAATNENLLAAVGDGRFREDLYYRLSALTLRLPPLRERPADVLTLARHFLRSCYGEFDVAIDVGFLEALANQPWPGNVRQLRHTIERTAILAGNVTLLTAKHVERAVGGAVLAVALNPAVKSSVQTRTNQGANSATASNGGDPIQKPKKPLILRLRRARLQEEFKRNRQLSRSQVVELLGCAPDTAGRDLKALEAEGFVRRVETSAHPRTGYYEMVTAD